MSTLCLTRGVENRGSRSLELSANQSKTVRHWALGNQLWPGLYNFEISGLADFQLTKISNRHWAVD